MDKKAKSMANNRGRELHRNAHGRGSFPRSSSYSGRFSSLHGEKLDNVSDPKSKKATPMRRPKTHPELLNRNKPALEQTPWPNLEMPPLLTQKVPPLQTANNKTSTKLLFNVTVAQSIGPLRVLLSTDATVVDVIKAVLALYAKEGRKPILSSDPASFRLHYSQFTIHCLNPKDKMKDLGSRNFFLCPEKESGVGVIRCGTEMEKNCGMREPWYKLMDCFLLLS